MADEKNGSTPKDTKNGKSNGASNGNGSPKKDDPQEGLLEGFQLGGPKRKHLESLIRHIRLVQDATQLLGLRLLEVAETEADVRFAIKLVQRGMGHDQTKFDGIEWEHLTRDEEQQELRLKSYQQHVKTNEHHPENWAGINEMPKICVAEMVCDWYARSSEMGTDLTKWIKDEAVPKFKMSKNGKVYKTIKCFVEILLDRPFSKIER